MNHQTNCKTNDTFFTSTKKVSCYGSSESSKHPLIYLDIGNNDFVVCPYCSKHFTLDNSSNSSSNNNKK